MTSIQNQALTPYLSPILVHHELLRGCAFIPGKKRIRVAVFIDGSIFTEIDCESPVPEIYREAFGQPSDAARSFLVPLPARVFDGAQHEFTIRLCKPGQKITIAKPGIPQQPWLLENRLDFRHGDCHGQVTAAAQSYQGWVAFSQRPHPMPQLTLSNEQGQFIRQISLIPVPTETGRPDNYLATFRISRADLPIPLRIHCGEIELNGSPCQPPKKPIGFLEKFEGHAIHGWAFDMHQPANPVELILKIDGQLTQRFRPNSRRPDVAKYLKLPEEQLGIVGFHITPPEILFNGEAHQISVEFAESGHPLHGSKQHVQIPKAYLSLEEIIPLPKQSRAIKMIARPHAPKVSIIILNRDGEAPLSALLESWEKHNGLTEIEFIIVDHASADGSMKLLKYWQSRLPIHLIPLSYNDSFSASCNRAASKARGQFLLFMNNDIVWLQDALPAMLNTLESDPGVGMLGLKLLKSTDDGQLPGQVSVQHLGVRFKLSGTAYWPYEVTPDEGEAEYAPQMVPAVTAAVMLCRKNDFYQAGQFDSSYFYGFEDVEFCLRFSHRLNKKIICRNDLSALHRHGHTRLSGRATDIFDRLVNNADVLQAHAGLWLKRNYWACLIDPSHPLTVDQLTIGFIIDDVITSHEATPLRARASKLARQILRCYPTVRIVFLPPSRGWYRLRNIHYLIVGHPEYDIGMTTFRRADLLILAWIEDQAKLWAGMPWWSHFDGYLAANTTIIKQLAPTLPNPIMRITATSPLGPLFNPRKPPLRIALLIPHKAPTQHKTSLNTLQQSLKSEGAVVWQDPLDAPDGPTRVADVCIVLCLNQKSLRVDCKPQTHTLNILWAPRMQSQADTTPPAGWQIVKQMPQVAWLHHEIESALGNTFRSS